MKKAGWGTYALLALIVLFAVGDLGAELSGDGKSGAYGETVSTFIHHMEKERWYVRVLVGLVTGWLFLHLTAGLP